MQADNIFSVDFYANNLFGGFGFVMYPYTRCNVSPVVGCCCSIEIFDIASVWANRSQPANKIF